jgi:hypothetical protein
MKSIYLGILVCVLFSFTSFASDKFIYALEKHQAFESNTSFDINDDSTIHLLVLRNKESKKYDLIPFYVTTDNEPKQLDTSSFAEVPELVSYHINGDILTVLGHYERTLEILDYSLTEGTVTKSSWDEYKKPKNVFSTDNKTVFVDASRKGESLLIKTIHNSGNIEDGNLAVPQDLQKTIKTLFKATIEEIETNEYVKDGSIANVQAYMENDNLYFVSFNKVKNDFTLVSVHPQEEVAIKKNTLTYDGIDKLREGNVHLMDGKLFALFLAKEDFAINIYDADNGEEVKSFSLKSELANLKRIKLIKDEFMKQSSKTKHKPTLAVNKNESDQYIVTVNYVNKTTYYYNNWWFHHHFMMHQQMMMNQNMPSKPGATFDPYQDFDGYFFEDKPLPLKIVLDKELNIVEDGILTPKKTYIDKEKYSEGLNEKKEINNLSIGFLKKTYHYMYTDRKEKNVYIQSGAIEGEPDYYRN